jgi:uncharacterized protein (UPF0332 family)
VQPTEFVALALHLAKPPKGVPAEASCRSSCSRSYYAAFLHARDALIAARFSVPRDGTGHREVIRYLKQSSDSDVRTAASLLENLRDTRNRADYDISSAVPIRNSFESRRANLSALHAQAVIDSIDSKASSDLRLGIVE